MLKKSDNDRNGYERLGTQFERIACQAIQKTYLVFLNVIRSA